MSITYTELSPLASGDDLDGRVVRIGQQHLARLERTAALGSLAVKEIMATAQYAVELLNRELARQSDALQARDPLTSEQKTQLHQLTEVCMTKLEQNAVQLDDRLCEILLR